MTTELKPGDKVMMIAGQKAGHFGVILERRPQTPGHKVMVKLDSDGFSWEVPLSSLAPLVIDEGEPDGDPSIEEMSRVVGYLRSQGDDTTADALVGHILKRRDGDIDPRLGAMLDQAVAEWGAMGVALAASQRTDTDALVARLTGQVQDEKPPTPELEDELDTGIGHRHSLANDSDNVQKFERGDRVTYSRTKNFQDCVESRTGYVTLALESSDGWRYTVHGEEGTGFRRVEVLIANLVKAEYLRLVSRKED
jgi:hypothetical protein